MAVPFEGTVLRRTVTFALINGRVRNNCTDAYTRGGTTSLDPPFTKFADTLFRTGIREFPKVEAHRAARMSKYSDPVVFIRIDSSSTRIVINCKPMAKNVLATRIHRRVIIFAGLSGGGRCRLNWFLAHREISSRTRNSTYPHSKFRHGKHKMRRTCF